MANATKSRVVNTSKSSLVKRVISTRPVHNTNGILTNTFNNFSITLIRRPAIIPSGTPYTSRDIHDILILHIPAVLRNSVEDTYHSIRALMQSIKSGKVNLHRKFSIGTDSNGYDTFTFY